MLGVRRIVSSIPPSARVSISGSGCLLGHDLHTFGASGLVLRVDQECGRGWALDPCVSGFARTGCLIRERRIRGSALGLPARAPISAFGRLPGPNVDTFGASGLVLRVDQESWRGWALDPCVFGFTGLDA